ncbi:MAG TPA: hypothetical protein VFE05_16000 [Longimicrobiaceae bacterium]|jgi:hypothetical protein|nr:hypothetical protein [Longimicrobiaceae bacterium]
MQTQTVYEIIGYVASGLVAVSLMMSRILRLRVINLVGSATFAVYGLLIHAYPVAAMNTFIVFINVYYLAKMMRSREYFRLLKVEPTSEYVGYFLRFYEQEVRLYLPGFSFAPAADQLTLLILRDLVPAGLFIAEPAGQGTLRVLVDFVIPQYRDFKTGNYLYREQAEFFRARGVRDFVTSPGNPVHAQYLRKIGFSPIDPSDPASDYRFDLADAEVAAA